MSGDRVHAPFMQKKTCDTEPSSLSRLLLHHVRLVLSHESTPHEAVKKLLFIHDLHHDAHYPMISIERSGALFGSADAVRVAMVINAFSAEVQLQRKAVIDTTTAHYTIDGDALVHTRVHTKK